MSPLVQKRVGQTLGFFGYGLGSTGAIVYALRNSVRAANLHWLPLFIASLGLMYGTHVTDYHTAFPLKLALYTGFTGCMALTMLPLI